MNKKFVKDYKVFNLIKKNRHFIKNCLNLVGSGNIYSRQISQVLASDIDNLVVEGYLGKRYHAGCRYFDEIEEIAIERGKKLFNAKDLNVQPHSGSQANQAVFLGLLKKGDKILSLSIKSGGHITHNKTSFLSEIYEIYNYNMLILKLIF